MTHVTRVSRKCQRKHTDRQGTAYRHDPDSLPLRRQCGPFGPAPEGQDHHRRQGREPCRNGEHRPAGPSRIHDHDRRVPALSRPGRRLLRRVAGCGGQRRRACRTDRGQKAGRCGGPAAGLGPLGRGDLDARHDGHGPQPRPQRRDGEGARQDQRRCALRVGQLPPVHPDVLGRGPRPRSRIVRGSAGDHARG